MTRIDFYRLDGLEPLQAACLITGKAYHSGYRVRLYAAEEARLTELDSRLWTYRQNAFVPHALQARLDPEFPEPVVLSDDCQTGASDEVLVCASPPPKECLGRYSRVAELVPAEVEERNAARSRYAEYRDAGYELHVHDLRAN